jgi:hypothetical protein
MFTTKYKGFYIHGYFDKDQCWFGSDTGYVSPECKSMHAAKCAITKTIRNAKQSKVCN